MSTRRETREVIARRNQVVKRAAWKGLASWHGGDRFQFSGRRWAGWPGAEAPAVLNGTAMPGCASGSGLQGCRAATMLACDSAPLFVNKLMVLKSCTLLCLNFPSRQESLQC